MTDTPPPPPNASNLRRQAFIRQASTPVVDLKKPDLVFRWLQALETGKGWTAVGLRDHGRLEAAWAAYEEERGEANGSAESEGKANTDSGPAATPGEKAQEAREKGKDKVEDESIVWEPPDPDQPLPVWRVPVGEDRLFEVDLRTKKLWPVFWRGKGCNMLRGSWFFDASKLSPCNNEVAKELEALYHTIQPWLPSYADELKSAVALGAEAEGKLRAPLVSLKGTYVIFLGKSLARLYSDDVASRMTKTLWTAWSGSHGGGTLVARGFDNARRLLRTRENKRVVSKSAKRAGQKTTLLESPKLAQGEHVRQESDSTIMKGAATPAVFSHDKQHEEDESAGALRSLVSKFGSWGGSSSRLASAASALPVKTQNDIKEAFTEAQDRAQGLENTISERMKLEKLSGMVGGAGLATDDEDGTDREEEEITAEEEAREEEVELQREEERDRDQIEVVLVWHGIGQKLAEEWKSLDFTLAVSSLRALAHKRQAHAPPVDVGGGGMPALSKGRRVQFIPVLWRATLQDLEDFDPPNTDKEASPEEHLGNRFSIDDIFSDTIPLIRQLISGILFDIPLYLSHHREEILSRVVKESNRVWRLFAQRNENFLANGGRTSLIAHSLGAALAVDILSKQPTKCPSWEALPHRGAELAFDVKNLYLAGSPVALFMWINRSQLIARKGRELTMDSPIDEALDRSGKWGCLAVDRVFNIFSASDPIGTRLNSTVDAAYAKKLSSIPLARATNSILRTLPDTLEATAPSAGIFGSWKRSSLINSYTAKDESESQQKSASEEVPDDAEGLFSVQAEAKKLGVSFAKKARGGIEDKWKEYKVQTEAQVNGESTKGKQTEDQGSREQDRAERRMNALCEFGSVDFVIPLQTSILTNQYMEFLWSHAGYWTDNTFADFLLATLFSSPDRLRQAKEKLVKEP